MDDKLLKQSIKFFFVKKILTAAKNSVYQYNPETKLQISKYQNHVQLLALLTSNEWLITNLLLQKFN